MGAVFIRRQSKRFISACSCNQIKLAKDHGLCYRTGKHYRLRVWPSYPLLPRGLHMHRAFVTRAACQQRTLTHPNICSCAILYLYMYIFEFWNPSLLNLSCLRVLDFKCPSVLLFFDKHYTCTFWFQRTCFDVSKCRPLSFFFFWFVKQELLPFSFIVWANYNMLFW